MADIQKLIGSESPLEVGQKINEIIDKGTGGLEIGDIGIAPLGIDETQGKRRYLNGQLIIQEQYVHFTKKVKSAIALYPSLACTESEWQTIATMTVGGQVGKFVVDNEGGTIRLPKIIMPIQGLTDLSKLGEIVEAGLPNIEGELISNLAGGTAVPSSGTGALKSSTEALPATKTGSGGFGTVAYHDLIFNASDSNPIYGNSNTVQQEQIQYPYFIQVATGAETEDNIINEIELNNPFSLLDYKFSEYAINNLSWLQSRGQWNYKSVYPAVYDLLLRIYSRTERKDGVSVKLYADAYTDEDFVIDVVKEVFRLPIKVKLASGKAVVGNGMTLGVTDGTNTGGLQVAASSGYITEAIPQYGTSVGSTYSSTFGNWTKSVGVTTDPNYSGIETSDSDLYLYFYVGETVQNANLINAGRIEETLVKKVDRDEFTPLKTAYITETYVNGTSWYRVYSDNWCEQGASFTRSGSTTTVTLLKAYKDTNYNIQLTDADSGSSNYANSVGSITETSFVARNPMSASQIKGQHWRACGYIA